MAPSPLRGEGWDEGRVLRCPSLGMGVGLVARLLACGGLSLACRPASYFSLLAQREVAKRNGLWSPPTLQALAFEVVWNRRDTSCSTFGHSAPSPVTEVRAWVSWACGGWPVPAWRALQSGSIYCSRRHEPSRLCSCSSSRRRPTAVRDNPGALLESECPRRLQRDAARGDFISGSDHLSSSSSRRRPGSSSDHACSSRTATGFRPAPE